MGCYGSKSMPELVEERDAAADAASKELDRKMAEQQKEEAVVTKLLVLGTGESGKSTIFKQMKILYAVPDPPAKYIPVCRANLIGNAHAVKGGMEILGIEFATREGKVAAEAIRSVAADGNAECTPEMVQHMAAMYADKGVDEAIERASEFQLNDSTRYFFERAADILSPKYEPTAQDALRARVRTTGIVQQNFQINQRKYTMFDVGGQRNECAAPPTDWLDSAARHLCWSRPDGRLRCRRRRRKWIHCFDNVTACIFVTAISEFDQARRPAYSGHTSRAAYVLAPGLRVGAVVAGHGLHVDLPPLAWFPADVPDRCSTRTRAPTGWTKRSRSSSRSATTNPLPRPR
jgi:hypothetical protein